MLLSEVAGALVRKFSVRVPNLIAKTMLGIASVDASGRVRTA